LYLTPTFGDLPAGKLDAELLERLYARLRRCKQMCDGRTRDHECRPLSASSVRQIHFILRAALDHGHPKPMPVLLLRHQSTGAKAWFANFHNPPACAGWNRSAGGASRRFAGGPPWCSGWHHDHPYPVLVTGDMNDHRAFTVHPGHRHGRRRRRHHHPHPVHPATPGPDRLGLRPPGVRFHRYATVTGPLARRTSDHPLIHAHGLPDHR
jgi:hypothetical protein